jgi:Domain of unknown function (DUF4123)
MEDFVQNLSRYLFVGRELNVYAVLDGASVNNLRTSLHILNPEYACLYRGELKPDMAEVAPYLVRLEPGSQFTDWVAVDGWGKHWGVFLRSTDQLAAVRRHLRSLLVVHDPDGQPLKFRFYDPRVMRVFLPTCNAEQLASFFGPIDSFLLEDESANTLVRFRLLKGVLKQERRTFTTETQENLEVERAKRELLRQELQPSEEEEVEMTEEELQQSLVDFWQTVQNYRPPKKPKKG